ncbi:hypothetical protein [Hwangdonia seohaensis]|uniref:DUF3221 domain-containing protein n=1 Tax=Hwangdonia seohaensis TaxID=1240727 RepID=A0ABW3R738_9FLAO|nr:hypothetical protein [Hwangdonia seohaensis]
MKTNVLLKLIGFSLSVFTLASFTVSPNSNDNSATLTIQDEMVVNAVYDGHEEYGYNFIAKNKDGEEYTITFQEIKEELLSEFDLKSEILIGKSFSITYQTRIEATIDDDGFEDEEEINTIINLKKL